MSRVLVGFLDSPLLTSKRVQEKGRQVDIEDNVKRDEWYESTPLHSNNADALLVDVRDTAVITLADWEVQSHTETYKTKFRTTKIT
jgi:hypothetical protein